MIAKIKHKFKRLCQVLYINFLYSQKERQTFRELKQRQIRAGKNDHFKPKVKTTFLPGNISYKDFYKNLKTFNNAYKF